MNYVYGYIRVSSDMQAESGLGLEAQTNTVKQSMEHLAKKYNLTEGKIYEDAAVRASQIDFFSRAEGAKLQSKLKQGDHVVIAKLDRAFRSQRDCILTCEQWQKQGVFIHLLDINIDTTTSVGKMFLGIISSIAEFESKRMGERIREAKAAAVRRGESNNWNPPIGWNIRNRMLIPNDRERKIAQKIVSLAKGQQSCREVGQWLEKQGYKNRTSKNWSDSVVRRWLNAAKKNFPKSLV